MVTLFISSINPLFLAGSLLQAEFRFLDWKVATPVLSDGNKAGLAHLNGINDYGLPADKSFCRGLTCTHGTVRTSVGARWRLLKSLTSSVFCTSLNKNNVFSSPFHYDVPRHESSSGIPVGQYFPEESVCTENIDMWKKLIPNIPFNEEKYSATTTDSNDIENESDNGLKGLIDKNWLLNSPWHSLRFESKSGIARNVTDNNNVSQHKKERFKRELSMILSITAILLPKTVPSHSMVLEQLEKYVKRNKNNQSKVLYDSSKQKTAKKLGESAYVDPCFIRLHRQVRDSRERNFFVEMIIEDTTSSSSSSSSCATIPEEHSSPSNPTHRNMTPQDTCSSSSSSSGSNSSDIVLGSTRVHVTELLPPFYDLLLHTYTYTITQKSQNNSKNGNQIKKDFYVADLESFKFHPIGLNDNECYNRNNDKKSLEGFELSPHSDYGESSRSCYGSISWSIDLPFGGLLRTQFTGEKKYLHREQYPSDASRGFVVPPVFVTVISTPIPGKN